MRYANQGISDQILHGLQPFGALVLWVNCGVDFVMKGAVIHRLIRLAFHPQNTVCGYVRCN